MIERSVGKSVVVRKFDELYFDGEAKEAVAFALLAEAVRRRKGGESRRRDRSERPAGARQAYAGDGVRESIANRVSR